jgi:hypothetical protein
MGLGGPALIHSPSAKPSVNSPHSLDDEDDEEVMFEMDLDIDALEPGRTYPCRPEDFGVNDSDRWRGGVR